MTSDPPGEGARLLGGDRNATKARAWLVRRGDRDVVMKTAQGAGFLARWQLRREAKVLSRMPPLACLPEVIEATPERIVTAHVPGPDLFEFRKRGLSEAQCAAMRGAFESLHAAGFAHGDLGRHDIVFREDGTVALLDFATAVGPGCPPVLWRLLLPVWKSIDRHRVARLVARYGAIRERRRDARG